MDDLRLLLRSRHPILYVETFDEERLEEHLERLCRELHLRLFRWSTTLGLHGSETFGLAETREPLRLLEEIRSQTAPAVYLLRDFHPFLTDPVVIRSLREIAQGDTGKLVTLVLCSPALELPFELRKLAARFRLALPTVDELKDCVRETFQALQRGRRLRFALGPEELRQLLHNLSGLTLAEARRLVTSCLLDDNVLDAADLPKMLGAKKEELERSSVLELVGVDGDLPALGGLGKLKTWLGRVRTGYSERAKAMGLPPPRGVLLVGVQGCGKSLAAKEIARQWSLPLVRLDPSRLFNKFVGESERNLRSAFETAEALSPLVLWIDEIEKVFAHGGSGDADAGLGRRLFGSFLTWMQEREGSVFVAATANDLDSLPPELLRKGRFDEIFFVDLPTPEARREILTIHLNLRKQEPGVFDLDALIEATEGYSGAEIEQAVVSALYGLLAENAPALTDERLLAEIRGTIPLSRQRAEEIGALREMARERFVMVE